LGPGCAPGAHGDDAPSAVLGSGELAPLDFPHLSSLFPPLLPLPSSSHPTFTPLGATVPLPPRGLRSGRSHSGPPATQHGRQARMFSRQRPSTLDPASFTASPTCQVSSAIAAKDHRRRLGPSCPGVSFSDSVLLHFHLLAVPAPRGAGSTTGGDFWIRPEPGSGSPSRIQVGNALNFRFSRPHYRFHVVCIGHELFSAHAATANLACYIVSCGRCRVGSVSLLLFPSLASAMAAGAASIERDDDVISPVQNPENQAPPSAQLLCPLGRPLKAHYAHLLSVLNPSPTSCQGSLSPPLLRLPRISRKSGEMTPLLTPPLELPALLRCIHAPGAFSHLARRTAVLLLARRPAVATHRPA